LYYPDELDILLEKKLSFIAEQGYITVYEESHSAIMETWRTRLIQRLANRPEGFSKNGRLISGCSYNALNKGMMSTDGKTY
jgi:hypothetical protein